MLLIGKSWLTIQESTINSLPIAELPKQTLNCFPALFSSSRSLFYFLRLRTPSLSLSLSRSRASHQLLNCTRFITLDWFYDQPLVGSLRHLFHCFSLSLYHSLFRSFFRLFPPISSKTPGKLFLFLFFPSALLLERDQTHTRTNVRGTFRYSRFLFLIFSLRPSVPPSPWP